jgi:acetylornithine/succinyldiaminopimelate/putrescine aminotransferase
MDARDIVSAADSRGLRIETAGETAVRIQPPLVMTKEDRQLLLDRLVETMEIIERETAELSL